MRRRLKEQFEPIARKFEESFRLRQDAGEGEEVMLIVGTWGLEKEEVIVDDRMQRMSCWLAQLGASEMCLSALELQFDIRERDDPFQAEFLESIGRCQRAHEKAFCIGEAKANWADGGRRDREV